MRVGVLTVSDRSSRGQRPDLAGPTLVDRLRSLGWEVARQSIVPDEQPRIEQELRAWVRSGLDLILTTGGTGFAPRDRTPEATLAVAERLAPGLAELMRRAGASTTPHAALSRAVAVISGQTLIVNLPGSPHGAMENLDTLLPVLEHGLRLLRDDPEAEAGHRPA